MSLVNRATIPADGFHVVPFCPEIRTVHDAEVVLSVGVALVRPTEVPADGFRVVPFYPETPGVQERESSLAGGVVLLGRAPEPRRGNGVVLLHVASELVPDPELRLRRSASRLRQLA